MQNEPIEVTLRVTGVLEGLGIPYLIGGSLASTLHSMIRTTQDSDIITEMRPEHIQPFVSANITGRALFSSLSQSGMILIWPTPGQILRSSLP
jgi:hypothetical protein